MKTKRPILRARRSDRLKGPEGLRVCAIGPADANAANLVNGDVVEFIKGTGAPLRCWVKIDDGVAAKSVELTPDSIGLGGVCEGDNLYMRPLRTPAGIAGKVWRERVEAVR